MTRTMSRRPPVTVREVCGRESKDLVRRAAQLFLTVCPDDYRDTGWLAWQMTEAPGARLFCAFDGDEMVGVGSFARVQWTKGSEEREGPMLDTLAVLPAYQGYRIGSRILRNMARAATADALAQGRQEQLLIFGADFDRNPDFFGRQRALAELAVMAQEHPDLYALPSPRSFPPETRGRHSRRLIS